MQAAAWGAITEGDTMLAILPIFHGFGLGVCVNAVFTAGGKSILVPTFTAGSVARLIKKKRPSIIMGVPTLYDALVRDPTFRSADLACIKGAFCGADHLPRGVKEEFESLVAARGGDLKLLEGYGLTEAVTAIMCMPLTEYREGSIGIPFPDMLAKVVKLETTEEAPPGEGGEICLSGPAVMIGHLDNEEETARHRVDGRGRLLLLRDAFEAHDQDLGNERLPGARGGDPDPSPGRGRGLRHRGTRFTAGSASEGLRRARGSAGRSRRDGRSTDRPLPRAPDQVVLPTGDRVPRRVAEDPCR
jgi:acyl-CoA synthetase (AMP-forming)/AMP-acid ligase II